MSKEKDFQAKYPDYDSPFMSAKSNPKHAYRQVGGETEVSLHNQIWQIQARKRS